MIEMLSLQLNALIMFHMNLKLVVADHCVTKKSELMACLRLFEVHHLASEVLFDCFVHLCDFFLVVTSDFLMSVNMMVLTIVMAISMVMLFLMMTVMARILVSVVMVRRLIILIVMHFNINSMRLVMVMFALMLMLKIDLFEQASVL